MCIRDSLLNQGLKTSGWMEPPPALTGPAEGATLPTAAEPEALETAEAAASKPRYLN